MNKLTAFIDGTFKPNFNISAGGGVVFLNNEDDNYLSYFNILPDNIDKNYHEYFSLSHVLDNIIINHSSFQNISIFTDCQTLSEEINSILNQSNKISEKNHLVINKLNLIDKINHFNSFNINFIPRENNKLADFEADLFISNYIKNNSLHKTIEKINVKSNFKQNELFNKNSISNIVSYALIDSIGNIKIKFIELQPDINNIIQTKDIIIPSKKWKNNYLNELISFLDTVDNPNIRTSFIGFEYNKINFLINPNSEKFNTIPSDLQQKFILLFDKFNSIKFANLDQIKSSVISKFKSEFTSFLNESKNKLNLSDKLNKDKLKKFLSISIYAIGENNLNTLQDSFDNIPHLFPKDFNINYFDAANIQKHLFNQLLELTNDNNYKNSILLKNKLSKKIKFKF